VWGEKDRVAPPGQAKIWASRIPKAKVLMVPDVAHFAMQEAPANGDCDRRFPCARMTFARTIRKKYE
jgi:pimeloyl-ACP methyl ester carboxylesterase